MRKGKIIFIVVGILILAVLFKSFGIEKTIAHIINIGWRFWLIVLLLLINHIFLTYGWRVLIKNPIKPSQFYKLVLARIAGDSPSAINSLGALAGEPIKALYIKDIIPFKSGLASVVMDRMIHTVSNTLLILTGVIFSIFLLDIPLYITGLTLLLILTLLALMIIILLKQRNGFIEYFINKLPVKMVGRLMNEGRWKKVKTIDEEIGLIFSSRENLRHFYICLFVHYASVLVTGVMEIYLIIKYIGVDITLSHALFVYVFGLFLTSAIFFMPANIGTSEGAYSMAFKFLGYDPAIGLSVGLIRRLRSFVLAILGMLILFHAGLLKKEVDDEKRENS